MSETLYAIPEDQWNQIKKAARAGHAYLERLKFPVILDNEPGTYIVTVFEDGSWGTNRFEQLVASAASDLGVRLAEHLGIQSGGDEFGRYATDDDAVKALRQPWPIAAAFEAMCTNWSCPVPDIVAEAMQDVEPLPDTD